LAPDAICRAEAPSRGGAPPRRRHVFGIDRVSGAEAGAHILGGDADVERDSAAVCGRELDRAAQGALQAVSHAALKVQPAAVQEQRAVDITQDSRAKLDFRQGEMHRGVDDLQVVERRQRRLIEDELALGFFRLRLRFRARVAGSERRQIQAGRSELDFHALLAGCDHRRPP